MSNALVLPSSLGIQETSIAEPVSVDISSRDNSPLAKPSSGTMLPLDVAGGVHGMPDYISSQNKSAPSLDRKRSLEEEIGCQEEAGGQEGVMHKDATGDEGLVEGLDPFVIGRKKLAQFWPTYVKETDDYDRELSDGWNKMLDVILIFAALFSAISTAFVLESSKDLKPDPAESVATTLLIISQTLLAMSNQSGSTPALVFAEPPRFVPATSAIVVNVLWFTSLILSVSVTLIAMLAKEWSHLYMVGRTGQHIQQARRRQRRFDGMKVWHMVGVITALPTLMHLALFLFAAGLCVYLWNIHAGVAIPVVILTSLTALIYLVALLLPLIFDYCPYATALSRLIKPYPGTWSREREDQPELDISSDNVPMDATTSRAIAWIVSNSEVPSSVENALQAIAGTSFDMPNEALWECSVSEAIYSRLEDCLENPYNVTMEQLKRLETSNPTHFIAALSYAQALHLVSVHRRENIFARQSASDARRDTRRLLGQLGGLYGCLSQHESSYIAAVGYAASAMCGRGRDQLTFFIHGTINLRTGTKVASSDLRDVSRGFQDIPNGLLNISRLAVVILKQQNPPPVILSLSTLLTALCSESTRWDPNSSELAAQRPQILQNMLDIANLVDKKLASSSVYVVALSMVGLAMNRHSATPLGDAAARLFAPSNTGLLTPSAEEILHTHDQICGLGLSGFLRALESEGLLKSLQGSKLGPVFDLLRVYVDQKAALVELRSDILGGIDSKRCMVEPIFDCYHLLAKRNIQMEILNKILRSVLGRENEPWFTPMVAALLEHSAGNDLQVDCIRFAAKHDPGVVEIGTTLLSNAFCEAVRLGVDIWGLWDHDVLHLTQRFETVSADNRQNGHAVLHALLKRLLDESKFRDLLVLMTRTKFTGAMRRWRGIRVGSVVRFWGEHIILWSRRIIQESENNDVAEKLRVFFASEEELNNVDERFVRGVTDLRNLLWQEISHSESPPVASDSRISPSTHLLWWNRPTGNAPDPTPVESV